jgi:hypothetical protein
VTDEGNVPAHRYCSIPASLFGGSVLAQARRGMLDEAINLSATR